MTDVPATRSAHRMPFGATVASDEVLFRFFAPACEGVRLELVGLSEPIPMQADGSGWHELRTPAASPGSEYRYLLPDGATVPDPASRYQPKDVHGPSRVMDPGRYAWRDQDWRGISWIESILYELHVGTFTPEGTFAAA